MPVPILNVVAVAVSKDGVATLILAVRGLFTTVVFVAFPNLICPLVVPVPIFTTEEPVPVAIFTCAEEAIPVAILMFPVLFVPVPKFKSPSTCLAPIDKSPDAVNVSKLVVCTSSETVVI